VNKLFLGVDPGLKGGICLIDKTGSLDDDYLALGDATDRDVWDMIDDIGTCYNGKVVACIEKIQTAILGIGKSQMSKLYGSYTSLRMCLVAAKIPFEEVDAKVWQKAIGIKKKPGEDYRKWKKRLRSKAQSLFPQENGAITLATCDALLIAEYCRRKHGS